MNLYSLPLFLKYECVGCRTSFLFFHASTSSSVLSLLYLSPNNLSCDRARGFDLYLNGHVHTLSQYTVDKSGAYVTSGAGAMVDTADQSNTQRMRTKKRGGDWQSRAESSPQSDESTSTVGHSYETVWNEKVAGFTLHTFSDDLASLKTDFIDYSGRTVHSFTVNKGAGYEFAVKEE